MDTPTTRRKTLVELAFAHPTAAAVALILTYVAVWTVAQALFFPTPRRDTVEIAAWAPFWPLGTPKHPPMPSWFQEIAFLLTGRAVWASYAVSMVTLGATLALVFAFGRRIASAQVGLIAVGLTLANYYFTSPATQFNHNVTSLLFGALAVFAYREAILRDRLIAWIVLGLAAAGLMLSKYSGVLLLAPLAVHALCFADGRARLRSRGPYVAIGVFAVAMIPHLVWFLGLPQDPVDYAFERRMADPDLWQRVWTGTNFVLSQISFHTGLLLVIGLAAWRFRARAPSPEGSAPVQPLTVLNLRASGFDLSLVLVATLAPPLLNAVIIGVGGLNPRPEWGGAYVFFSGLAVALLLPRRLEVRNPRALGGLFAAVLLVLPFAVVITPHLSEQPHPALYPAADVAAAAQRLWVAEVGDEAPLRVLVGPGDPWTYAAAMMLDPTPRVIHGPNPAAGLSFDPDEVRRTGAVILWPTGAAPVVPSGLFTETQMRHAATSATPTETARLNLIRRGQLVALTLYVVPPQAMADAPAAPPRPEDPTAEPDSLPEPEPEPETQS